MQRRGLVVGLRTASNATGQRVFLPLLALREASARRAFDTCLPALFVAGGFCLLAALMVLSLRRPVPQNVTEPVPARA